VPAFVNAYYGSGVAGFGAPLLLALTADATGSYNPALYATALFMLVGAAIPRAIRPP
jgi:hypothetical protein